MYGWTNENALPVISHIYTYHDFIRVSIHIRNSLHNFLEVVEPMHCASAFNRSFMSILSEAVAIFEVAEGCACVRRNLDSDLLCFMPAKYCSQT